jgi:hypothetical protein
LFFALPPIENSLRDAAGRACSSGRPRAPPARSRLWIGAAVVRRSASISALKIFWPNSFVSKERGSHPRRSTATEQAIDHVGAFVHSHLPGYQLRNCSKATIQLFYGFFGLVKGRADESADDPNSQWTLLHDRPISHFGRCGRSRPAGRSSRCETGLCFPPTGNRRADAVVPRKLKRRRWLIPHTLGFGSLKYFD